MPTHYAIPCAIFLALALLLPVPGYAEEQGEGAEEKLRTFPDLNSSMTLNFENDTFDDRDGNYTNGVRLARLTPENEMPRLADRIAGVLPFKGNRRWHLEIGQSMFTPSDITQPQLQRDDRPYAGWLYAGTGILWDTGYHMDNLNIMLGMVGPASGAEHTQKFVHSVVDAQKPLGWTHQLRNEPGIVLTYERKWHGLYEFSPFGLGADIIPSIGGSVGNIYTYASAGAVLRIGYDLPSDYGPPLMQPNLSGSDFFIPEKGLGWYLFAGADGRAVGRNIFLDGNTWKDSHSVDKHVLVGGLQAGVAITLDLVRISYTHNFRSKEFEGQRHPNNFGVVTLSWRY